MCTLATPAALEVAKRGKTTCLPDELAWFLRDRLRELNAVLEACRVELDVPLRIALLVTWLDLPSLLLLQRGRATGRADPYWPISSSETEFISLICVHSL